MRVVRSRVRCFACHVLSRALSRVVRVYRTCCFTCVARAPVCCACRLCVTSCRTRTVCVPQCCFARVVACRSRVSRVLLSRVVHFCRAVSARDNKLFSLINTHVNNINLSGHIFYIINLTFVRLILIRLIAQLD